VRATVDNRADSGICTSVIVGRTHTHRERERERERRVDRYNYNRRYVVSTVPAVQRVAAVNSDGVSEINYFVSSWSLNLN